MTDNESVALILNCYGWFLDIVHMMRLHVLDFYLYLVYAKIK